MSLPVCSCRPPVDLSAAELNELIRVFTAGRAVWTREALREWQRLTRMYGEACARERLEKAA